MLEEFVKIAEENPAVKRGFFILREVLPPEPSRRHFGRHNEWVCAKQRLYGTLAFLKELSYVSVVMNKGMNYYRVHPDCLPYLKERLAMKEASK